MMRKRWTKPQITEIDLSTRPDLQALLHSLSGPPTDDPPAEAAEAAPSAVSPACQPPVKRTLRPPASG